MVIENKQITADLKRFWQHLEKSQKDIILYFIYTVPPVSIDTLSFLSQSSAIIVLNVMESLKKKRMVCEKKGYGKGIYFPTDGRLESFVQKQMTDEDIHPVAERIIEYYAQSPGGDENKTLLLADLHRRFGDNDKGIQYLKKAGDILYRSGQKREALTYYDSVLEGYLSNEPTDANVADFLDSIIGKVSIMMYQMPVPDQVSLLNRAHEVAKKHHQWDRLAKIKILLSRLFQDAGKPEKASRCVKEFLRLAERVGDRKLYQTSILSMSEYFAWKGLFSEATRQYEQMVGDLEEFGDNEIGLHATVIIGFSHVLCGRIARGLGMIDAVRTKAGLLNLNEIMIRCDLITAYCLLELRQIPEAELHLGKVSAFSEDDLGHHILWGLYSCMAYVRCQHGDYEDAFFYYKKSVQHARSLNRTRHPATWGFETLRLLESHGYRDEEMNFDTFVNEVLSWDDVFMKGVALRCRALRNTDQEQMGKVLSDLMKSEEYLKRSGAEIELARTRVALYDYFQRQGETNTAQSYHSKVLEFATTIDRALLPRDLSDIIPPVQKIQFIIDWITKINESLGTTKDISTFLERVINVAMDFTMAMRGAFVTVDEGELKVIASRNFDSSILNTEKSKQILDHIATAASTKESFRPKAVGKAPSPESSTRLDGASSMVCAPVQLGGRVQGYLCLDNRLGGKPFSTDLLPFLRLLCSQIAIGLSSIKAYDKVRQQKDRLEEEASFYKKEMGLVSPIASIIGKSDGIKNVFAQIHQVAPTDSSVLITGETGVGKELVAKAIHNLSQRKDGPFIPVNLAALPQELVASELFGHEKGAFTGANERQKGRFELADKGTIFLDEIGDLPTQVQVKLLRVLQEGSFERLGSAKRIQSNFRVIAATNKNLPPEVEKGTFRQDLYFRLNVFPIHIPPLRERKNDIPVLAHCFIDHFGKKLGKRIVQIPREEMKKLANYFWPGNVRELEHFIERAVVLSDGRSISFSGLEQALPQKHPFDSQSIRPLEDIEREYIQNTLQATGWKVSGPGGAASLLGLKTSTLRFRIKKLGIEKPSVSPLHK